MSHSSRKQLVTTVKDRCRVCYTCVRECPAKAIKIINGQAEVLSERCIGCGNCVKVCSQNAKIILNSIQEVYDLLNSDSKVAAIIAPSFPAEFSEIEDHTVMVGMIKKLGFDYVSEVSFGADMVANEYKKILKEGHAKPTISSDCPGIVFYVEHYHPKLVPSLATIASPMVAMTRIMKKKYGSNTRVVFIGPCIAKKAESDEVDDAITFKELREMLETNNINPETVTPYDFDPPKAGKGAIFPVSRGLLQTVDVKEDICEGSILVADGRVNFGIAIKEWESGYISDQHLELLCCKGCIMGPGMSASSQRYSRRTRISQYVRNKLERLDQQEWKQYVEEFSAVDFSQEFRPIDRRIRTPLRSDIDKVLKSMGKFEPKDHLNCGACGYETCKEHAVAIVQGLAENEMCLPYTIEKLHNYISELNISNEKLASTRQQLMQSEKLASMGQLSAGIAHELNNPLGVIMMYSNILKDEMEEGNPYRNDLELIVEQADRCKKIVSGLLNFARKSQVNYVETDFHAFVQRSLESMIKPDNVELEFKSNLFSKNVMIDKEQMMQVLTNLEKNAVEAMPDQGGKIEITLEGNPEEVIFTISDTGTGISKENMEKIFTPFFTTKGIGKGTGLGLPLIYGIVKMHKGQISVDSNADPDQGPTGTTFSLRLPRQNYNKQEVKKDPVEYGKEQ
ncbi:MAG: 4Fe-4S binding protein [Bacteroidales bacterium]|nr:4Fe-4S binding protein [Bacteroidales bacterium]